MGIMMQATTMQATTMQATTQSRSSTPRYAGPERRVHRMYVTRNTEYHLRRGVCVAVRDRRTESWLEGHLAVGRALGGGVRVSPEGLAVPGPCEPSPGDALYFSDGKRQLVTSVLCQIDRPSADLVAAYPT